MRTPSPTFRLGVANQVEGGGRNLSQGYLNFPLWGKKGEKFPFECSSTPESLATFQFSQQWSLMATGGAGIGVKEGVVGSAVRGAAGGGGPTSAGPTGPLGSRLLEWLLLRLPA